MAEPFLGQITLFSFVFAPKGWALCNGQLLSINQNQALFSLLGTTYGGDGRVNFALPDLRGRVPMHTGSGHTLGERAGEQAHTLTIQELPVHMHTLSAYGGTATPGAAATPPTGNSLAQAYAVQPGGATTPVSRFSNASPNGALNAAAIGGIGGSQPHQNMQPFVTLSFCIALQGIFPSQN
ncbi:phage tail protein [Novosphingobium album (ex Liu et al. 2023)]|uniref:Tail fiber protein n=1 Tax=Novosphingobium album (ex Liu et al. 2023) TaxID=3031130 RepID=A0ABT5WMP1_9SPHN|nr:tail fiber protein [Novosphingobium album (ex Liu et al. 2023)]MDE8651302.1 tail fiber protein [Novosphingobium album (ex Liu et al. 2023)]